MDLKITSTVFAIIKWFRCNITETGNRSVSKLTSNCIEVCYKQMVTEASKPASLIVIRYITI